MNNLARFALRLLGLGLVLALAGFAMAGFSLENLDTRGPSEQRTIRPVGELRESDGQSAYPAERVTALMVTDEDHSIIVRPSADGQWRAVCYERKHGRYEADLHNDGVFRLHYVDDRPWYERVGITYCGESDHDVLVYVPAGVNVPMTLSTVNGAVSVEDVAAQALSMSTTNGDISAKGVRCAGEMRAETTNGAVLLTDSTAQSVFGQSVNGPINFTAVDARRGDYRTTNGGIAGSLAGAASEYTVSARTALGDNNLTSGGNGPRQLNVKSVNGSIDVAFAP
ncbi:DUF4097 family beta strand repeat-containing protein [Bacillota bacterium Meth-B3]